MRDTVRVRRSRCPRCLPATPTGYDVRMSEPTPEGDASTDTSTSGPGEGNGGMITDDQLPDDLNPEKNPLAKQPDEDEDTGASPGPPEGGAGPGQPG